MPNSPYRRVPIKERKRLFFFIKLLKRPLTLRVFLQVSFFHSDFKVGLIKHGPFAIFITDVTQNDCKKPILLISCDASGINLKFQINWRLFGHWNLFGNCFPMFYLFGLNTNASFRQNSRVSFPGLTGSYLLAIRILSFAFFVPSVYRKRHIIFTLPEKTHRTRKGYNNPAFFMQCGAKGNSDC